MLLFMAGAALVDVRVGRTVGHGWAVLLAASGQFSWPPAGNFKWPLTLVGSKLAGRNLWACCVKALSWSKPPERIGNVKAITPGLKGEMAYGEKRPELPTNGRAR